MINIKLASFNLAMGFALGTSASTLVFSQSVQAQSETEQTCQKGTSRGVSRGNSPCSNLDKNFLLCALTPDDGKVHTEQPTLQWSISQDIRSAQFELTLRPVAALGSFDFPDSLIDETKTLSIKKGVQSLSLKDYDVKLVTGTEYMWSVSLVCDPNNPSLNIFSTGKVKRVTP